MADDSCSLSILTRRGFLRSLSAGSLGVVLSGGSASGDDRHRSRVRGMLLGSLIGDALGGPVEFQQADDVAKLPQPLKQWKRGEKLSPEEFEAAEARLRLRPYAPLRPTPEPYAHWSSNALAGTITDDSRHKFVLMHALRKVSSDQSWPLTSRSLAQAFVDWPAASIVAKRPDLGQLSADWLEEFLKAARWELGDHESAQALPPERMWIGLPTCCGQMILPPLAGIYPGEPEAAYRAAYALGFFDNGFGKDLNAGLIAGLAAALALPAPAGKGGDWMPVLEAMRNTDPFEYGKVPWTTRPVDRWLDFTQGAVQRANNEPAALFAELNQKFAQTIKWQAEVPFVIALAAMTMCPDHPLAALQLSIEWGLDTDSYAALAGAFIGARYGEEIFPEHLKKPVIERLDADYEESIDEWCDVLAMVAKRQAAGSPVCAF